MTKPVRAIQARIDQLRERFAALGQAHVFAAWDRLDTADRQALLDQAAGLEPHLEELLKAERDAVAALSSARSDVLEPVDAVVLPEHGGDPARREAGRTRGEAIQAEGRVAAFVVAGGQGTRLGYPGPKGGFPIGPVTDRCLFELQAQKLRGLSRRSGCPIPWYVMTSEATDAATRALFEKSAYFGLPPEDVFIFPQDMVPAFDFDSRLLMATPGRIFESPNGHGGSLTALDSSGALRDMERRGVDTIFYYQVDNPLVKIADPVYLGLHDEARAEMSCKVIRKRDPDAKWGVVARINGRIGIVEYTELDDEHRHLRDADGELVYWAGSPAIHVLSTDFVRRVAANASTILPFHASRKVVPHVDSDGRAVQPTEPNGIKLERFVFDALPAAERVCIVEASAPEEFSPVKNAEGPESPAMARCDLMAVYRRWLEAAGLELPEDRLVEIDHSRIDGPEEAAAVGLRSLAEASDFIRVAPGTRA